MWGMLISIDDSTSKKSHLDKARMLISTACMKTINGTVNISINNKILPISVCEEFIEGSLITQLDDVVDWQGIGTTVSKAISGINIIPKQSMNWVPETLSACRVHSLARMNICPMGTQAVNVETPTAPQIRAGKRADHSTAFGGGGIKMMQKKLHSGSRLTGGAQLQIGEKENEVAELGDRVLYGKGMAREAKKGGSTTDTPLDEKKAEEWRTGGPDATLGNQNKGNRLPRRAKGKHTMGCRVNRDRAECSKAHIAQEESDGLDTRLATLLKKKKRARRDYGQQNKKPTGSHKKNKGVPIMMGRFRYNHNTERKITQKHAISASQDLHPLSTHDESIGDSGINNMNRLYLNKQAESQAHE
ncbi:hypothetical protein Ancab_011512, partial [Ancistrocladus abbreviatus]